MLNPELQRNLWLEISLHRLLMMPLLIALVVAVSYLGYGNHFNAEVARVTTWIFVIVTLVWGAKRVVDSVSDEQTERTWDWQRMSGISPWALTWGKWLGASVYPWFGGLIALALFLVIMAGEGETFHGVKVALLLVAAALNFQGAAFVSALLLVRREAASSRYRSSTVLVLLLLLLLFLASIASPTWVMPTAEQSWEWYRWTLSGIDFWLLSGALFVAWCGLGAYRLMRGELQYRGMPGWWIAFVLFLFGYFGGFVDDVAMRWLVVFAIAAISTMGSALAEPKDPVDWRGGLDAWRRKAWREVLEAVPLWLVSLGMALCVAVVFQLVPASVLGKSVDTAMVRRTVLLSSLFLTRDVTLLIFVSLAARPRRTEAATLLYLIVLYLPLPWLFQVLGWEAATVAFWPRADADGMLPFVVVAAEVAAMLGLLRYRWKSRPSS